MPDPVSWMVMEPGWRVQDAAGNDLGKVDEIRGDANADIFDGITVKHGVFDKAEYIPSEQITEIVEGAVVVSR